MSKDNYRITISYNIAEHEWSSLDEAAEKVAGVKVAGGGTDMGSDQRDLNFYYPTLRRAANALARFRKDKRFQATDEPTSLMDDLW